MNRNEWLVGRDNQVSGNLAGALLGTLVLSPVLSPNVDNAAHVGGAIAGALISYYYGPRVFLSRRPQDAGYVMIDRPIQRLPPYLEAIPEQVGRRLQRVSQTFFRRSSKNEQGYPWRQQRRHPDRGWTPNRSIKPRITP